MPEKEGKKKKTYQNSVSGGCTVYQKIDKTIK
jgi:hypothetical protein